jgi:hypothetical protein
MPLDQPVRRCRSTHSTSLLQDEIILIPGQLSEKAKGKRKVMQEQMDEEERREKELEKGWVLRRELDAEAEERERRVELDRVLAQKMQKEYDDVARYAKEIEWSGVPAKESNYFRDARARTFPVSLS